MIIDYKKIFLPACDVTGELFAALIDTEVEPPEDEESEPGGLFKPQHFSATVWQYCIISEAESKPAPGFELGTFAIAAAIICCMVLAWEVLGNTGAGIPRGETFSWNDVEVAIVNDFISNSQHLGHIGNSNSQFWDIGK